MLKAKMTDLPGGSDGVARMAREQRSDERASVLSSRFSVLSSQFSVLIAVPIEVEPIGQG